MKFYPYEKGGGRKKFKPSCKGGGGGTTSFEVVLTRELGVLAILCICQKFPPFERGGGRERFYPVLRGGGGGGGRKTFQTCDFPIL